MYFPEKFAVENPPRRRMAGRDLGGSFCPVCCKNDTNDPQGMWKTRKRFAGLGLVVLAKAKSLSIKCFTVPVAKACQNQCFTVCTGFSHIFHSSEEVFNIPFVIFSLYFTNDEATGFALGFPAPCAGADPHIPPDHPPAKGRSSADTPGTKAAFPLLHC